MNRKTSEKGLYKVKAIFSNLLKNSLFRDIICIVISRWRCNMAVCYDKLFHMMIDKRMTNSQLMAKAGFSANIITRLKKNEYISLESIEKLCIAMECSVDDILEFQEKENDNS